MAKRSTNTQVGVTWQEVSLPLGQGVDLRSNDRARPQARLSQLLNGSFAERNSVVKRFGHRGSSVQIAGTPAPDTEYTPDQEWVYGYGRYSPTAPAGWQPSQDQVLGVVTREDQVAAWTGDRLVTYDAANDTWHGESDFWDQVNGSGASEIDILPQGLPLFAPHGPVVDVPQRPDQVGEHHVTAVGRTHRLVAWTAIDSGPTSRLWVRVETLDGTIVMEDRKVLSGTDRNGALYDLEASADIHNLRPMWLGGYLCVVAEGYLSDDLVLVRVPESDPLSGFLIDDLVTAATDVVKCWDTVKVSDELALLVYRDGTTINITYFRGDVATVSAPAGVGTALDLGAEVSDGPLGAAVAPNGDIGLVWLSTNGTDPVRCAIYDEAGGVLRSEAAFDTGGDRIVKASVAAPAVGGFVGYADCEDRVVVAYFDVDGGVDLTKYEQRYACSIAGQAFAVGNIPFVTVVTKDRGPVKQATYVLQGGIVRPRIAGAWARSQAYHEPRGADGSPPVVIPGGARDLPRGVDFKPDQSPLNRTRWVLSFSHQPRFLQADMVYHITGAGEGLTPAIEGRGQRDVTLAETRGLRVELDFTRPLTWASYGRCTYFSGAQPHVWDGAKVTEAGFLQWPDHLIDPAVANNAGANWDTQDGAFPGTYRYRVYFCRRNKFGEVSRSPALTFPLSDASPVSVPDATSQVTLTLSTLEVTEDEGVYYEIYRTLSGGTVYHLISGFDVNTATKNTRETNLVQFVDTVPDSLAEDLPTDPHNPDPGNPVELEEVALPGCEILAQANDRLWFAGGMVPSGQVFFSKTKEPGEQAAWNDLSVLEYTLDNSTKPVTGIGDLGGRPVIFRSGSVYTIGGLGPDNLGNGSYEIARRLSTDLGAVNQFGVVKTPDGLGFFSSEGPRVVTESEAIGILGDEVTPAAVGRVPVASVVATPSSQVRWYLDDGNALVYDYVVRFWAEHTGLDAVAGVGVGEGAILARDDGKILFEQRDLYSDAGRPYEFRVRTSELRPEELLQGSHRCRRWAISGAWRGSHELRTRVRFDGAERVGEEWTWRVTGDLGNQTWGSSGWPSNTTSSRDGVYRTRRRLSNQRFSSISFEFSDRCAGGDSFVITELALELGQKDGLSRLPSRNFV